MARLTLRLPAPLHAELAARSRECGKSINQLVVDSLEKALERERPAMSDERARMLAALGDLAMDGFDFPDPENDKVPLLTHEELQRLPPIHPSLSESIIADREDRL
jgi:hypothetical protein